MSIAAVPNYESACLSFTNRRTTNKDAPVTPHYIYFIILLAVAFLGRARAYSFRHNRWLHVEIPCTVEYRQPYPSGKIDFFFSCFCSLSLWHRRRAVWVWRWSGMAINQLHSLFPLVRLQHSSPFIKRNHYWCVIIVIVIVFPFSLLLRISPKFYGYIGHHWWVDGFNCDTEIFDFMPAVIMLWHMSAVNIS